MNASELLELLKTHPNTKPAYVKAADSKSYPAESLHEKIVSKAPLDIMKLQNPPASVTRSAIRAAINKGKSGKDILNEFNKTQCQNADVLLEAIQAFLELNSSKGLESAGSIIQYSGWKRMQKFDSVLMPFIRDLVKKSDVLLNINQVPYWIEKEYLDHDLNYINHPNISAIDHGIYDKAAKSGLAPIVEAAKKKYKDVRSIIHNDPHQLLDPDLWGHIYIDKDLMAYLKSPEFADVLAKSNLAPDLKSQIRGKISENLWFV